MPRPDLTVPVSRLYLERHPKADTPARYCYNGPAFRFQPQGDNQAHPREFRQAGIECFGESDKESADVEIVLLAVEAVRSAGLKNFSLRFGDIALFYALLDALSLPERWRLKLRHYFWRPQAFHALLARLATRRAPERRRSHRGACREPRWTHDRSAPRSWSAPISTSKGCRSPAIAA